ncbi:MAG: SCO family protein [Pseudomonadota bacterium]
MITKNRQAWRVYAHGLLLGAILALSTGASADDELPYYNSAEFTPHWLGGDSDALSDFHRIPAFEFTNQNGESVSQNDTDQKVYVASFFFSTCPGICPKLKSKLQSVQTAFLDDDNVLILSHSIRPSTDTPEILQQYAQDNGVVSGKWHLLTGEQQVIYELARSAYFANEDLGTLQDQADFLHTENLLLIDQDRRIRGVYNGLSSTSVAHLVADIRRLL